VKELRAELRDFYDDLGPALADAMRGAGPALVDVVLDPAPYSEQLRALRG
jgi:hypothetical protein